ncbi:MAG TPA: efflux transporter outer membrane subunit [Bryobacteraceae bacterium]|nr:efflux transporter outer membrane subunit [Bryobacteraceae bacterium]
MRKYAWMLGAAMAWLTGCNPAPKYSRPTFPAPPAYKEAPPDQYKEVSGWKIAEPSDDKIRRKWWEMYNDRELNQLEQQVQISNQTIAQAEANFRAARAVVAQARSALFPTVTAGPSFANERFGARGAVLPGTATGIAPGTAGATGSGTFDVYSLPIDVSYTADLWHKARNTVAANAFTAQASAADVATAMLSTQAELANDYFQVRQLDRQRALLGETIKDYRQTLELTQTLFRVGLNSQQDVAQAQTQLNTTVAQATDLGVARAQYEHAIAALIGRPPAEFSLPVAPFQANPPPVPVAVPSKLLERRPDIASAERRVAAANAQVGVAKAAYYPDLTLSASGGFESTSIANWFTWPSRFWSLGPSFAQTLLDFGARRGATEQAEAQYDAAVANYRQTVLNDFQAVEDNLAALRILEQELGQQREAIASARTYLDLALNRFKTGIDSYLNVITAQTALLTNQVAELQIQLRQMTASVNLVMGLGGGWDVGQLPQIREVSHSPKREAQLPVPPEADRVAPPNPPPVK